MMNMQLLPTTLLGNTGLKVTRLGFGTALHSSDKKHWTDETAKILQNQVLDSGINFIDTAYDYVDAERRIGSFLGTRYNEFVLATKCGCTDSLPTQNSSNHVWTRDNLFKGLEGSLSRLGRNNVDILQLHNPTIKECETGGLVDALLDMKKSGKVQFIGVSTTLPHLPTYLEWGVFDVMQIPYSALERTHEDWITRAGQAGVGIIIRGGIAKGEPNRDNGVLGNKEPKLSSSRDDRWKTFEQAKLDDLKDPDESRSAFVLRYTLTHPYVHTIIVGTTSLIHLRENISAVLNGPLEESTYAEVKSRLDSVGECPTPL